MVCLCIFSTHFLNTPLYIASAALLRDDAESDSESNYDFDDNDDTELNDEDDDDEYPDLREPPAKPRSRRVNPKKTTKSGNKVGFFFLAAEQEVLDRVLEEHSFGSVPSAERHELASQFSAQRHVAMENQTATFQAQHAVVSEHHIAVKLAKLRAKSRGHAEPLPPAVVPSSAVARALRESLAADIGQWSQFAARQLNKVALAQMCELVESPVFCARFIDPLLKAAYDLAQRSFDERCALSAVDAQSRDLITARHQVAFTESFEYGANANTPDEETFADIVRCTAPMPQS